MNGEGYKNMLQANLNIPQISENGITFQQDNAPIPKCKLVKDCMSMQGINVLEWLNIPQSYLSKLIESMPARIKAVIKNKGSATKY